jgi:hypothetical protein
MPDKHRHPPAFFENLLDIEKFHLITYIAGMPSYPTIFISIFIFHTPTYSNIHAKTHQAPKPCGFEACR